MDVESQSTSETHNPRSDTIQYQSSVMTEAGGGVTSAMVVESKPLREIELNNNQNSTASTSNIRRTKNTPLSPASKLVMADWLKRHLAYPYPTEQEKTRMRMDTGLSRGQVKC